MSYGIAQAVGFLATLKVKEARPSIFGMKLALDHGLYNIVVEGDCASLMVQIKRRERHS